MKVGNRFTVARVSATEGERCHARDKPELTLQSQTSPSTTECTLFENVLPCYWQSLSQRSQRKMHQLPIARRMYEVHEEI